MDNKTLVERLHIIRDRYGMMYDDYDDITEAATRIEALEAALREIMNDDCLDPWSKAKQALEGE